MADKGRPCLIAQGNANKVYKVRGGVLRVSTRGVEPETVIAFGRNSILAGYLPRMEAVDSALGRAIFMAHIGITDLWCEFKPKWLAQSPDAPANARQCRTCAIRTMRGQTQKWCPLQLAAKHNLEEFFAKIGASHASEIADFFRRDPLLELLVRAQAAGSVFEPASEALLAAMSARDVTVMIEGPVLSAKLVDLDPKSPSKLAKWRETETKLRGFYLMESSHCYLGSSFMGD